MNNCINRITGVVQAEIIRLINEVGKYFVSIVPTEFITDYVYVTCTAVPAAFPVWLEYDDYRCRPATGRRTL